MSKRMIYLVSFVLVLIMASEGWSATDPDPYDGEIYYIDTWAELSWTPGDTTVSNDVYFGDNFDDVYNGTGEMFRGNQIWDFFIVGLPGSPFPDGLVPGTTYYWRIDDILADETIDVGDVWSFWIPSKTAYGPFPTNGAVSVEPDITLSWEPGMGAKLHTVYFGDDYDTVTNATGGAPQVTTYFDPPQLDLEKFYYWRVDEFDGAITYKGYVWNFTTAPPSEPVADPDGPYVEDEGTQVIFDGSGSSNPDGDPLEYRWDFDYDGTWDTTWSTDPMAVHTYGDNWTGQARLEVSNGVMTDTDPALVTINNVAPDAWIEFVDQPNPDFILPHHVLTFVGSFTDPGWLDIHEALWDFSNGTTAPGIVVEENNPPDATGDASVQYAFPQPGIYSVTLAISDDDGGNVVSAPWIVTVLTGPQEMLAETSEFFDDSVELGALVGEGSGDSAENRLTALRNMLEAASDLIEEGLYEEACDQLWAAYRKCDGDPRPPDFVTGDAVNELADMIQGVMDELGCE